MNSTEFICQRPDFKDETIVLSDKIRNLVLYNDDVNTFEHVIMSLVDICNHDTYQAEQCAYIVHFKGKCDVKNGHFDVLYPMKEKLKSKGLSVTID
jgi:ATP-dependent Clp protease adaptor protein ClpS